MSGNEERTQNTEHRTQKAEEITKNQGTITKMQRGPSTSRRAGSGAEGHREEEPTYRSQYSVASIQ